MLEFFSGCKDDIEDFISEIKGVGGRVTIYQNNTITSFESFDEEESFLLSVSSSHARVHISVDGIPSNCGMVHLYNFNPYLVNGPEVEVLLKKTINFLSEEGGYTNYIATLCEGGQDAVIKLLRGLGFKTAYKFLNNRTGNTIRVMHYSYPFDLD